MRSLHPSSIAVRSLSRSLNTGTLFFVIGIVVSPGGVGPNLLVIGAMAALGVVVGVAYEFAYYERFRYELTADTFDVTSGVLSRREREVPLRRVQNVDVRQNVVSRAFGIAAVHVETAGGGRTEVTLRYVGEDEARRLRQQLRRGAGDDVTDDETAPAAAATDDEATGEELLFEIQPRELAVLSAFTIDPGASLLGGIALSFASGFDPETLVPIDLLESWVGATGFVVLAWGVFVFLLAAWVVSAALMVNRYYGFRLTRVGDQLHYERGLVQRYSGTIPLEKVQTLTITESIPFRWFGYGALAVETAGYAPGQSDSRGSESAVPLASRDRVAALARSIEPFGRIDLERPPRRARERYAVRYGGAAVAAIAGGYLAASYTAVVRDWYVLVGLLALVPAAAHLKWASRGYRVGDRYFLARTGFWRRTTKVVPHYRVQTVIDRRTIFQRRRRLASLTADTASSATFLGRAATAADVDAERAREMRGEIERLLQVELRARRRRRTVGRPADDADSEESPADSYESPTNSDDPSGEDSSD